MQQAAPTPVLILTGPVGVGKTTVAAALSDLLNEQGLAHAVIDMDWLHWCHPSPAADPFHLALGLRNLRTVWTNYRAAGAQRLVLVDIVETQEGRATYYTALPDSDIRIVRLTAPLPVLHARLAARESGTSLAWHRRRAAELSELMEAQAVGDWVIETANRTAAEVAGAVLAWTGWGSPDQV